MAKNSKNAKMGEMMIVKNSERHPNANDEYVALWVEDESGDDDTEQCLLFRKNAANKFITVKFGDGINLNLKKGRLYSFSIGEKQSFIVLVKDLAGVDRIIRLTDKMLCSGEDLAEKNPEDIPERGFFNDLID